MAAQQYENDSSRNSTERVREGGGPAFPDFDSLPANAGLTNAQAFQLSLRHALVLLPKVLAARDAVAISENSERFSLR